MWMFDGSSTRQADGGASDCLLKPVAIYPDPQRINGYLVMCEVLNPMEHHTHQMAEPQSMMTMMILVRFEQEYFIWMLKLKLPLGFPWWISRPTRFLLFCWWHECIWQGNH